MQVWRNAWFVHVSISPLRNHVCVPAGWDRKLQEAQDSALLSLWEPSPLNKGLGVAPSGHFSPSRAPYALQTDASFLTPALLSPCTMTLQCSARRESRPLSGYNVRTAVWTVYPAWGRGSWRGHRLSLCLESSLPFLSHLWSVFFSKKIKGPLLFQSPCLTKTLQKSLGWVDFIRRFFSLYHFYFPRYFSIPRPLPPFSPLHVTFILSSPSPPAGPLPYLPAFSQPLNPALQFSLLQPLPLSFGSIPRWMKYSSPPPPFPWPHPHIWISNFWWRSGAVPILCTTDSGGFGK